LTFSKEKYTRESRKVISYEGELDKWFEDAGGKAIADPISELRVKTFIDPECKADKWAVITTIFGPTKLIFQLETLADWCTVVIADAKTPMEQWNSTSFTRVKLLTMEEQRSLPFKSLPHIPVNHFGRKNLGYLFAIRAGAKYIYDTDDDNVLRTDANGAPLDIPIVDAKTPPHEVAQAWYCNFDKEKTRSWNPYALYGQPTAWPRGLPLDEISVTSRPCSYSYGKNITNLTVSLTRIGNCDTESDATYYQNDAA